MIKIAQTQPNGIISFGDSTNVVAFRDVRLMAIKKIYDKNGLEEILNNPSVPEKIHKAALKRLNQLN